MRYLWILVLLLLLPLTAFAQVKAFPTAEGFGAQAVGGRGGTVYKVTNLNNSGTGSLRACMEATGPRTCIFTVGGTINLTSAITVQEAQSYLTVAGQTAPGGGINIGPYPISIFGAAHDIIIRHVRHTQGYASPPPDVNNDCGSFVVFGNAGINVYNIILDHVSVRWECDDSVQASGVVNATYQWMLIAEGYDKDKDPFGESKGIIGGGSIQQSSDNANLSVHHSIIMHSVSRNPGYAPTNLLDWRNNLVYNWYACVSNLALGGTDEQIFQSTFKSHANFVGNVYIGGPDSNTTDCLLGELWRSVGENKVYVQNNYTPWCGGSACAANEWALGWGDATTGDKPPSEAFFRSSNPFTAPAITMTPTNQVETLLTAQAGATKPSRDSLDTRLISELQSRTGSRGREGAPYPSLASGTAPTDTDGDGIPDSWESSHGLNPNNGMDGAATAANGYTNLENYLNELAGDGSPPAPPTDNANPIFMAPTGNDSVSCQAAESSLTPKATWASACTCMTVPGKTLYIRAGTYTVSLDTATCPITAGTVTTPTLISGYAGERPLLQLPASGADAVIYVHHAADAYLTFKDLDVDGMSRSFGDGVNVSGSTIHDITFDNVRVANVKYNGYYISDASTVKVLGNGTTTVQNSNTAALVETNNTTNVTIQGLVISTSPGGGIALGQGGSCDADTLIAKNKVFNVTGVGINVGAGPGKTVQNNLVYENTGVGILIQSTAAGTKVQHNTVTGNTSHGIQCDALASGTNISNNIAVGNGGTQLLNNCGAVTAGNTSTGLVTDIFTNPATDNYTLRTAPPSPAINHGTPLPGIVDDLAGTARPYPAGGAWDDGCYEAIIEPPPVPQVGMWRGATWFF